MPVGDWIQAGRISSQRFNNAMTAVSVNSLNPNQLIQASMKARSREKQMAIAAESTLKRTEIDVNKLREINKARLDEREAGMNLTNAKRKAGKIAAAGAIIAKSLVPTPDPIKPYMRDTSAFENYMKKYTADTAALQQDFATKDAAGPRQISDLLP